MQTVIVRICKNKNGDISDATTFSESFEHYILSRISLFVATTAWA